VSWGAASRTVVSAIETACWNPVSEKDGVA
jgi:hypothetical protein